MSDDDKFLIKSWAGFAWSFLTFFSLFDGAFFAEAQRRGQNDVIVGFELGWAVLVGEV